MKIVIKGSPKEIVALVTELREQPKVDVKVDLDMDALCQPLTRALGANHHPCSQNRCGGAAASNYGEEQQLAKHLAVRYAEELERVHQKGRSQRK